MISYDNMVSTKVGITEVNNHKKEAIRFIRMSL